jgi:replicative DNA helicase
LLGALLAGSATAEEHLPAFAPEWFADPVHAAIFKAIEAQAAADFAKNSANTFYYPDGPDLGRLGTDLHGALVEVGGAGYLHELAKRPSHDIHAAARAIRDVWLRRQLIDLGSSIVAKAFDGPGIEALHHGLRRIAELAVMP